MIGIIIQNMGIKHKIEILVENLLCFSWFTDSRRNFACEQNISTCDRKLFETNLFIKSVQVIHELHNRLPIAYLVTKWNEIQSRSR